MKTARYYRQNAKQGAPQNEKTASLYANKQPVTIGTAGSGFSTFVAPSHANAKWKYFQNQCASLTPRVNNGKRKHLMINTNSVQANIVGTSATCMNSNQKDVSGYNFSALTAGSGLNRTTISPMKQGLGRLEESETGLGCSTTFDIDSKLKSPIAGFAGRLHMEESQAGTATDSGPVYPTAFTHRKSSQFTNINVESTKRDSFAAPTPSVAMLNPMLITEGEENLSESEENESQHTKNEAHQLETRISEAREPQPSRIERRPVIAVEPVQFRHNGISINRVPAYRVASGERYELQSPRRYDMLQTKWKRYMVQEIYRIKGSLAEKNSSPLKRFTERKYSQYKGIPRSLTPLTLLSNKVRLQVQNRSPERFAQNARARQQSRTKMAVSTLLEPNGLHNGVSPSRHGGDPSCKQCQQAPKQNQAAMHHSHFATTNIIGREGSPNYYYTTKPKKTPTTVTFAKEHQIAKERNEREDRITSTMIENYERKQRVPFGTVECEGQGRRHSLSQRRVATSSREKFWRDHLATNIQVFHGFKLVDMEEKEKEVHHTLRHHFGDRKFTSHVSIQYADRREQLEPYKSRYNTGAEKDVVEGLRFMNFHNSHLF